MIKNTLLAFTAAVTLAALQPAFAQQSMDGVDPACVMTGSDGVKSVDTTKCPDGKTPSMAQSTGDAATPSATKTDTTTTAAAPAATDMPLVVPADMLAAGSVMTVSDYIGKRVYDASGNDIGEVNDIILSADGKLAATILGVGGFLGIGEKDVAVPVGAVKIVKDGDTARLQIAATKEQLQAAPGYDKTSRTYLN
jgi:sporulation protein YlmC with PRC-barrel domain